MSRWQNQTCLIFIASFILLISLFMNPTRTYGDGKIYPGIAYKAIPSIPHQRVVIVFKDGQEQLIMEASFTGPSHDFGWIVPVPSQPTSFKAVSPGFLKMINIAIHPDITYTVSHILPILVILAFFIFLWSLRVHFIKPSLGLFSGLLLLIIPILMVGIFMPALSTSGEFEGSFRVTTGVHITGSQDIGNYSVVSLEAQSIQALNKWLSTNGVIQLPQTDSRMVTQYIQDGWQFVAAKLHREKKEFSRPHPLAICFSSPAPIYPMRLNGTIGNDMYLELFVIAEESVYYPKLNGEVTDRYQDKGLMFMGSRLDKKLDI